MNIPPMAGHAAGEHVTGEPSILYFGTPVVLVSTLNEDGTPNLAPISSASFLGWRCLLGYNNQSKTPQNLLRAGECVINLPSVNLVGAVNRLARLTGTAVVPEQKKIMGYRYEPRKFEAAGLTPVPSQTVSAPRVLECPVQLEAVFCAKHDIMQDDSNLASFISHYEVRITRVHLHPSILLNGNPNRIDPNKWRPLIMSFQKYYGLGGGEIHESGLAEIDEWKYRMPDVDRARDSLMAAA